MPTRTEIEDRFRLDTEAAEGFRDVQPDRYDQLMQAARDRRYSSLEAELETREVAARTAQIDATRARVVTQYPLADPKLITGTTPEEIEASAKALNDFAKRNREEADALARGRSRSSRADVYDRGGVPSSQPTAGPSRVAQRAEIEAAQDAKDANDEMRRQSGLSGDKRDRSKLLTEEETMLNIRKSGRASGLSMEAFKARNEGSAVLVPSNELPERLSSEDSRG